MGPVDEILDGHDYFYCEKASCTLRVDACIQRQKANRNRRAFVPLPFPICEKCTRGAENRLLMKSEAGILTEPKPRRGDGHRNIGCPEYSRCLDLAAKKDWKTFNCEGCIQGQGQSKDDPLKTEKKENTRLCDCGKTTLSPSCPLCPSCMAKRSNKGKSAKEQPKPKRPRGRPPTKRPTESPGGAPKKEKTTKGMPKSERVGVGSDTALTVEFGKYSHILKQVEKLAEEEMRPVELQVVYMLRKSLETGG